MKQKIKINVLGSCISRVSLLDGVQSEHGIADDRLELGYFLDKQNIVAAMMPPAFTKEEVQAITVDELYDKSRLQSLKQTLNKETLNLLLESDADYLVMDFYDMGIMFLSYKNTCMATQANEFCRTNLFRKYQDKMYKWNLYELPIWIWYTYVDLFMEKIMTKYDSDHIILNRFRCNSYYLDLDGKVKYIPDGFRMAIQPNPKYNQNAYDLEKYFIEKYNPWVIDLSKYFMGDRNCRDNLNGAHFEKEFYRETFDQIKRIIFEKDAKRYYDEPDFFNKDRRGWSEDIERKFDVDAALCSDGVFYNLLNSGDILWLNILDKMNMYAPDNKRVIELVEWMNENNYE